MNIKDMACANDNTINLGEWREIKRAKKIADQCVYEDYHLMSEMAGFNINSPAPPSHTHGADDRQEGAPPSYRTRLPAAPFNALKRRIRKAWKYAKTMLGG